jgi:hypothetical protein
MERAAARCGPSKRPLENGRMLILLFAADFFFIGRAVCRKAGMAASRRQLNLLLTKNCLRGNSWAEQVNFFLLL